MSPTHRRKYLLIVEPFAPSVNAWYLFIRLQHFPNRPSHVPPWHILRPFCVTSNHQSVRQCVWAYVSPAFCQTSVHLYGPYAGIYRQVLFQGLTDCVCVHLDGQTFSYHGISYHSVCTTGDQPFYAKGPRPLL